MRKRVALIVGHVEGIEGAVNYLGESEWTFNSRIAQKMKLRFGDLGIESEVFYKKKLTTNAGREVAGRVNDYGPSVSLELHFNSFHREAFGAEVLSLTRSELLLAEIILGNLESRGIRNRGIKFPSKGERGYLNLAYMSHDIDCSYIIEPCFGGFRNHETREIFEHEDSYVLTLVDSVIEYFQKEDLVGLVGDETIN